MVLETLAEPQQQPPGHPAWRWLLRRWWVLLAGTMLGTMLALVLGGRSPATYVAEAVVVGGGDVQAEDFGPLAERLVATDTVLDPVITELGLDTTPEALLADRRVEAHSITGSASVSIVTRGETRDDATQLALAVGDSFARAAEARELGTFDVFGRAGKVEGGPISLVGWGVGGALAGALLTAVLLLGARFLRQPMLTLEEAEAETRADTTFMIRLRRSRGRRWELYPRGVIPAIWRSFGDQTKERRPICIVLVERRRRADPELRRVASELSQEASQHQAPRLILLRVSSGEVESVRTDPPEMLAVAGTIVGIISAGARRDSVRALEEAATALGSPGQRRVLIFVARGKGRTGRREAAPRLALPPATVMEHDMAAPARMAASAEVPEAAAAEPKGAVVAEPSTPAEPVPPTPSAEPVAPAPPAESEQAVPAEVAGSNGESSTPQPDDLVQPEDLEDDRAAVRLEALQRLLSRPDPRTYSAVRDRLRDPDPAVRSVAVSVLAAIRAAREGD